MTQLSVDQKFVWDKLLTESFHEIEDHFFDRAGSWIDVLDGEFGAQWFRQAVLHGKRKTFMFLDQYGWDANNTLYASTPTDFKTVNYTLGAVVFLEGEINQIEQLMSWGWLQKTAYVTNSSQVSAMSFAILNRTPEVATWLIKTQSSETKSFYDLSDALIRMNKVVNNFILSKAMTLNDYFGNRYKAFVEHIISTHFKTSPDKVLEHVVNFGADSKNNLQFNDIFENVFIQLMLQDTTYISKVQNSWNNLLNKNPDLWFKFAIFLPMDQIVLQEKMMLEYIYQNASHTMDTMDVLQRWVEHSQKTNPSFYSLLSPAIRKTKNGRLYYNPEVKQACGHARILLETKSKIFSTPHAARKI